MAGGDVSSHVSHGAILLVCPTGINFSMAVMASWQRCNLGSDVILAKLSRRVVVYCLFIVCCLFVSCLLDFFHLIILSDNTYCFLCRSG